MPAPDPATLHAEQARALLAAGDAAAAHEQAVLATCLSPFDPELDALVGACLVGLGRLSEAADALARSAARDPRRAATWTRLGEVAERLGDLDAAARAFERALALAPEIDALRELASIRVRQRRLDAAAALYRRMPAEDPTAIHMLAALAGATPAAPPPGHVRALFDSFAPEFDATLVGDLGYEVPGLVRAALGDRRFGRVLDLGCGTGLAGAAIRDRVDWLEGVDVSPRMVERARRYDALIVGDMIDHLDAGGAPFDLVVAADVLLYLGDLAPLHAAVRRRLAPGGWFVYSVERGDDLVPYRLAPTGRYVHGRGHLEACAREFASFRVDAVTLRREAGAPVAGWIAVLVQ